MSPPRRLLFELLRDYEHAVALAMRWESSREDLQAVTTYERFLLRTLHILEERPHDLRELAHNQPLNNPVRVASWRLAMRRSSAPRRPRWHRLNPDVSDRTPNLIWIRPLPSQVACVTYPPKTEAAWIAAGCINGVILLVDAKTGEILHEFSGRQVQVNSISASRNSPLLVSGSVDNTLRLWHLRSGQRLGEPRESHEN